MAKLTAPKNWDYTTDVLVVGAGSAGMPAAIAVAKAGSKVTILELTKMAGGSGNLIMAGGSFPGTDWQKKLGIEDSAEVFYKDGVENGKGDPDIWRVLADNHLDTYRWFEEMGVYPVMDELMAAPGHTINRLHRYVGAEVEAVIEKNVRAMGIEILYQHRALRLIVDPATDRVIGARVQTPEGIKYFKARKGVILANGSFGRNKEMLKEYGSRFVDCIPLMAPGHLGDGLKMAFELGAQTSHIGDAVVASLAACTTTHADRCMWAAMHGGGIIVNVNGERFVDESAPGGFYGQVTDAALDQPGKIFWIIYDQKGREIVGDNEMSRHKEFKADTLEELAKIVGVNAKGLVKTVEKFHDDIDSEGYDTVIGRKHLVGIHGELRRLEAPFYCVIAQTSITSFKGGLKVNSRCQCVNVYGEVIPGLYGAGELIGGLFSAGCYLAGVNWSGSMTFGRVAGMNAANEQPWDK